ncbi:MAG: Gfo/Idh/MocA family oxidoreductase [Actinobacteria bacterium]|nr:Gfo/Idh/MocA family oxidoreductase [Actinomycetota bacterium]
MAQLNEVLSAARPDAAAASAGRSGPLNVGFIGCGHVSGEYLQSCPMHPEITAYACADLDRGLAEKQAREHGVPHAYSPDELLADPDVELVVNLTPPTVHAEVSLGAIAAGKHVFSEKPLAPTLEEGREILDAAEKAGVLVGCAPSTHLGGPLQTLRKVVDDGWVGEPRAATSFFSFRGGEYWHPNIDPFYAKGAGPMLDIGCYLITSLINIFGPASRVAAVTKQFDQTRPRPGGTPGVDDIKIEVATHAAGTIEFESGPVVTLFTSWEMWASKLPFIEIYGTQGTVSVPYDDVWGGQPMVRRGQASDLAYIPTAPGGGDWREAPPTHNNEAHRAVALADQASAVRLGTPFRASGELAYHTLEIMLAYDESSERNEHVQIASTCEKPAALPPVAAGEPVSFR